MRNPAANEGGAQTLADFSISTSSTKKLFRVKVRVRVVEDDIEHWPRFTFFPRAYLDISWWTSDKWIHWERGWLLEGNIPRTDIRSPPPSFRTHVNAHIQPFRSNSANEIISMWRPVRTQKGRFSFFGNLMWDSMWALVLPFLMLFSMRRGCRSIMYVQYIKLAARGLFFLFSETWRRILVFLFQFAHLGQRGSRLNNVISQESWLI